MARTWTDAEVEAALGNLLRVGVLTAAAVVFAGGVPYPARHGAEPVAYRVSRGEPADLRGPGGIVGDALAGSSRGWIQLGVLALVATPVLRVAFSAVAFLREGDRLYVGLTLAVLALLLFSLFAGAGG